MRLFRSGWPQVALAEHFAALMTEKDRRDEQRFDAQTKALDAAMSAADKAVSAALLAAEKAVAKAEAASERRFESVNEFRGQLADQARTLLPRAEYVVQHQALDDKVDAVVDVLTHRIEANAKQLNDALLGLNVYQADAAARRGAQGEALVQTRWSTGMLVTLGTAALAAGIAILSLVLHH